MSEKDKTAEIRNKNQFDSGSYPPASLARTVWGIGAILYAIG